MRTFLILLLLTSPAFAQIPAAQKAELLADIDALRAKIAALQTTEPAPEPEPDPTPAPEPEPTGDAFFERNRYAVTHTAAIPLEGLSGATINRRTGNVVVLSERSQFAEVDDEGNILKQYTIAPGGNDYESLKYVRSDADGRDWYAAFWEGGGLLRFGSVAPGGNELALSEEFHTAVTNSTEAMGYDTTSGVFHVHKFASQTEGDVAASQIVRLGEADYQETLGPYSVTDLVEDDNRQVRELEFVGETMIRLSEAVLQEFNYHTGKVVSRQALDGAPGILSRTSPCEGLTFRDESTAFVVRDVGAGNINFYVLRKQ